MKTSINFWHLLGDVQLGTLKLKNGMVQLVQKGTVKFRRISQKRQCGIKYQRKKRLCSFCLPNYFESVKLSPNGYERRKPEI
jgi:hypothetical protein